MTTEPFFKDALDPTTVDLLVQSNLIDYKAFEQAFEISTGTKYDKDKSRMDLLDSEWLESVGDVLAFGASKYAANNWRGGIHVSRLIGAAMRHIAAINRGEEIDPESGLPHSAHASCCLMFLHWMLTHRKDLDDRWIEKKKDNPELDHGLPA